MGIEIERKFLVTRTDFLQGLQGQVICQGYVARATHKTVRVRRAGDAAFLTIKGDQPGQAGLARQEFEYAIPLQDAQAMLETLCEPGVIHKTRYEVEFAGKTWEVDVFEADNAGLVVAELELEREDEPFEAPPWLGLEVTQDARYLNANLARHPYGAWSRG